MKPVLVDAGFLVAAYDKRDPHHTRCLEVHRNVNNPLVTCEPVLTETFHLLRFAPGASDDILASVEAGLLAVCFNLAPSAAAVRRLMLKYSGIPADFADACLIQMADTLDTGDILTLDSDFKHYRWRRNRRFRLLIPLD